MDAKGMGWVLGVVGTCGLFGRTLLPPEPSTVPVAPCMVVPLSSDGLVDLGRGSVARCRPGSVVSLPGGRRLVLHEGWVEAPEGTAVVVDDVEVEAMAGGVVVETKEEEDGGGFAASGPARVLVAGGSVLVREGERLEHRRRHGERRMTFIGASVAVAPAAARLVVSPPSRRQGP